MVLQLICEMVPIGAITMCALSMSSLNRPIKVDEEVWLELIHRKYEGRFHNINEPLREALGLSLSEREPVKNYSDEGNYGNSGSFTKNCRARPGLTTEGCRQE